MVDASSAARRVTWLRDAPKLTTETDPRANLGKEPRAVRLDFMEGSRSESSRSHSRKSSASEKRGHKDRKSGSKSRRSASKESRRRKDDKDESAASSKS